MADNPTQTQDESGYSEQSQSAFAEEKITVVKDKGNKGKLIMLAAGLFLVLIVAFVGFNAYKKATAPAAQVPAQPVAVDPAAAVVVPVDPTAIDPNAVVVDPLAPAPSDTDLFGAPLSQPGVIDPAAQPAFQDPNQPLAADPFAAAEPSILPLDPNAAPALAPTLQQQVEQTPQLPAALPESVVSDPQPVQVTVQTPPAANQAPVNDAVTALDQVRNDIMAGFDELRRSIEGLSARQASFETSANKRFETIERRLSSVETGRPVAAPRKTEAPARKATPVAASKPRPKPRPAPAPERHNSFEIIAPAPAAVAVVQTAPAVILEARPAPVASPVVAFCPPSAVQPGRFWVRQSDGSFRTYGEGDRLGAGTISKIDPASGIFVDGALVCAGR